MNATDLLRQNVTFTHGITMAYLADIKEDEMFVRAVEGSNHLAWQLGHLVASEQSLLRALGADAPDLPDGFAEAHDKSTNGCDDADKFHTKGEYLALMDQMHQAAITAIETTSETELDAPSPEQLRGFFPTVGTHGPKSGCDRRISVTLVERCVSDMFGWNWRRCRHEACLGIRLGRSHCGRKR